VLGSAAKSGTLFVPFIMQHLLVLKKKNILMILPDSARSWWKIMNQLLVIRDTFYALLI
jgi:hypothetical protein